MKMANKKYTFKIGFKDSVKKGYQDSLIYSNRQIDDFPYDLKELITKLANKTSYNNLYIRITRTKDALVSGDEQ